MYFSSGKKNAVKNIGNPRMWTALVKLLVLIIKNPGVITEIQGIVTRNCGQRNQPTL